MSDSSLMLYSATDQLSPASTADDQDNGDIIQLRRLSAATTATLSELEEFEMRVDEHRSANEDGDDDHTLLDMRDFDDSHKDEKTINLTGKQHSYGHLPFPLRQLAHWYSSMSSAQRWRLLSWLLMLALLILALAFGTLSLAHYRVLHPGQPSILDNIIGPAVVNNQTMAPKEPQICMSAECIKTSAVLLSMVDQSVDPCSDFFQYSCRNWDRLQMIPPENDQYTVTDQLADRVLLQLRDIFDHPSPVSNGSVDVNIHTLYWTCMDELHIETQGAKPILPLIAAIRDKFPYKQFEQRQRQRQWWESDLFRRDTADEYGDIIGGTGDGGDPEQQQQAQQSSAIYSLEYFAKLTDAVQHLHGVGVYPLFRVQQLPDDMQQTSAQFGPRFRLVQSGLGLESSDRYTNERVVNEYRDIVWEAFHLLLADPKSKSSGKNSWETEHYYQLSADVVDFERSLAAVFWKMEDAMDPFKSNNPTQLHQLVRDVSVFTWRSYLEQVIHQGGIDLTRFTKTAGNITEPFSINNLTLIIATPSYFTALTKLLRRTPPKTLYYYLVWCMIRHQMAYLSPHYQLPYAKLQFLLGHDSSSVRLVRWKQCVQFAVNGMSFVAGQEYMSRYFNQQSLADAGQVLRGVEQSIHERFAELAWMDDRTRRVAYQKESQLRVNLAYPDWLNNTQLNGLYADLQVDARDYFTNAVNLDRFQAANSMFNHRPSSKLGWPLPPHSVGTLYDLQANALTIGAGLLQPPFFSPTSPLSLNYGGFGSLIGRDLIRPYDHQGRLYNVNGSTEPWWTVETDRQFRNGTQCFVDSYDSLAKQFPVAGGDGKMTYDARITLMEDMADVGGLGLAYRSWQRAYSSANVDQRFRLPGLPWTEEQLFFIAYAQNWCGLVKPPAPTKKEKTDKSVWIDPRSPPQLRVNGAVAQSEQFSKAFQCPSGRPMNPQKKCQTW